MEELNESDVASEIVFFVNSCVKTHTIYIYIYIYITRLHFVLKHQQFIVLTQIEISCFTIRLYKSSDKMFLIHCKKLFFLQLSRIGPFGVFGFRLLKL
jgi:hypothetical protein